MDLSYLANIQINIDDMLKVASCHLAGILTNTNNKADNFIRKKSVIFN